MDEAGRKSHCEPIAPVRKTLAKKTRTASLTGATSGSVPTPPVDDLPLARDRASA